MQTLRQVLGREEERQNLKNMGFCYLLVVTTIALIFSLYYANTPSPGPPADGPGDRTTQTVRSDM